MLIFRFTLPSEMPPSLPPTKINLYLIGYLDFYVFPNENWTNLITIITIKLITGTCLVVSLLHSIWLNYSWKKI